MNFKQAQEAKILKRIPLLISTFQQTKIVGPIRTYLGLSKAWMVYVSLQEGEKLLKSHFWHQYLEHSQLPLHCKKKRLLVLNSQCISSVCLV